MAAMVRSGRGGPAAPAGATLRAPPPPKVPLDPPVRVVVERYSQAEPDARFVVLRREKRAIVESWYYWTEAGATTRADVDDDADNKDADRYGGGGGGASRGAGRPSPHGASGGAQHLWAAHDGSQYAFDEWDLTFPKVDSRSHFAGA